MKLFIDAHSFDNGNSEGVTTYVRGIYQELTKLAPDIDFYFGAHDTENLRRIFGEAPNVRYLSYTSRNKYRRLAVEIPRLIKSHKIDAAHYQYVTPLVKNCKEIVTVHDILFKDFPALFPLTYRISKDILFKRSVKSCDLLLTVSEYSKERLQHHYKVVGERVFVTPNAVAEPMAVPETEGAGYDYILLVSRIEPRKNHRLLLEAYNELQLWEKGLHLVLVGQQDIPVPELDEYIKNQLSPEAKSYIHFMGRVPAGELPAWYRNARLFVYPSMAEGFGIPPLEVAIAGVPCLCSDKTAMKDFNFFGDWLFDPEDKEILKEKMMNVLSADNAAKTERIKSEIMERYNWRSVAENFLHVLRTEL